MTSVDPPHFFPETARERAVPGTADLVPKAGEIRSWAEPTRSAHDHIHDHIQARYDLAIKTGKVGIWDWNLITNHLQVDGYFRDILGYDPSHQLEHISTWLSLVDPEDLPPLVQQLRQFIAGDQDGFALEYRMRHRRGKTLWVETRGILLRDDQGQPTRVICMGTNVTQQHEVAHQIQQQSVQLQEALNSSRLLATIASRIRQSLELDDILNTTVAEVRQLLQADRVMIYRLDQSEQGGLLAESVEPRWQLSGAGAQLHQTWLQMTTVDQVMGAMPNQLGRQSYMIPQVVSSFDPAMYPLAQRQIMAQMQVQAKLVVPILQGAHRWGTIVVHQCSSPRQWQAREVDLLEGLATQVAIAVQQAQLFQTVQQQAQRERLLNQILGTLNSSLNPQYVLDEIAALTGQTFGVDRAYIFSLSSAGATVLTEWQADDQVPAVGTLANFTAALPHWADPERKFSQRQCCHIPDYSRWVQTPPMAQLLAQTQTLSLVGSPIFIRDKFFGGLVLETTRQHRHFSPEDLTFLQRLADQAAIALYNAQNYEYLEFLVQQRTQALEQQKQRSDSASQAKSHFLAMMSHELRTPLSAILGLSTLLSQEITSQLTPKQQDYLTCIQHSGEHLMSLIGDILDLAKTEAGSATLAYGPVQVATLCQYCLSVVQDQAQSRQLQLHSQIAPTAQDCWADERRLRQILINLLSNAIKFTDCGAVTLTVSPQDQGLAFAVTDTGIGIPAPALDQLFEPFQQVDSQLNRQYEGTGLGLALSRQLARLHGGDITVDSHPGQGSTFTLWIPRSPGARAETRDQRPQTAASSSPPPTANLTPNPRILIVDQESGNARPLQHYLEVFGYPVALGRPNSELAAQLRQLRPQLVLIAEPIAGSALTGLELIAQLRHRPWSNDLAIVMLLEATISNPAPYLAAGANACLHQPIDIPHLELMLERYL